MDSKLWPECIVCGVKRRNCIENRLPTVPNILIVQDELGIDLSDIVNANSLWRERQDAFLDKYCSIDCFNQHLRLAKKKAKERVYSRANCHYQTDKEFFQDQLRQILIEEEGRCRICGDKRVLELHHIIPREYGGKTTRGNCVLLCPTCHALTRGKGFIGN
jgi:hypothetical protein